MKRLAALALCAAFSWHGAHANETLCEKDLAPSAPFARSALVDLIYEDYLRGRLDAVFEKLHRAYEESLTAAERQDREAEIFLGRLKGAAASVPQQWVLGSLQTPEGGQALFSSEAAGERVEFDCMTLGDARPAQFKRDMVSIALLMQKILLPQWNAEDKKRFALISTRLQNHEDVLKNGLPMWPWELWLNGKRLGKNATDPLPTTQIIFMRPGVGVEINTRSRQQADLEGSLLIEPIGMIWYRKPDFSHWIGLSAVVTSSTSEGMGYGFLFRYGRYTAGVTRHKSDTGRDDTYLMLGVDLYDLMEKKRESYEQGRARLKRSFGELVDKP